MLCYFLDVYSISGIAISNIKSSVYIATNQDGAPPKVLAKVFSCDSALLKASAFCFSLSLQFLAFLFQSSETISRGSSSKHLPSAIFSAALLMVPLRLAVMDRASSEIVGNTRSEMVIATILPPLGVMNPILSDIPCAYADIPAIIVKYSIANSTCCVVQI